jgi:hypothetical protein
MGQSELIVGSGEPSKCCLQRKKGRKWFDVKAGDVRHDREREFSVALSTTRYNASSAFENVGTAVSHWRYSPCETHPTSPTIGVILLLFTPTLQEIATACGDIQTTWSPHERIRRGRGVTNATLLRQLAASQLRESERRIRRQASPSSTHCSHGDAA